MEWQTAFGVNEPPVEYLVFAGNGMAAVACAEELLKSGRAFDITIFGEERHGTYDHSLLPSVFAGERDAESIVLNDFEWYQEHGIRTRLGIRVEEIDRISRAVRSSDGDWTGYDKLILATGSMPRMPSIEGLDKTGVFVFGSLDEIRALSDAAVPGARAVVVGGSMADKVSRVLRKRGCDVVIVESSDSSQWQIETILGHSRVEAVRFTGGEEIGADLVAIATDLQPNATLARETGLEVNRGIVVNDRLETPDPNIFALGTCIEQNGQTFDSLPPLLAQAKALAVNLAAAPRERFTKVRVQELATSPLHHLAE